MSMAQFFLAATLLFRAERSHLPRLAGVHTLRTSVLAPVTAGCLCFLPGQCATAQSNEPRPIDAVTSMLNTFDKNPIVALGDLHGRQALKLAAPRIFGFG